MSYLYANISTNSPVNTGTGNSGQVYTIGVNGSQQWADTSVDPNLQACKLQVNGDAEITGELIVKHVRLSARLDKIDERLGILHPNEGLENKWAELKELRNRYLELEAEIIEKEAMWAILNK